MSTRTTLCQVPRAGRPSITGTTTEGDTEDRQQVVRTVTLGAVAVTVTLVTRQEAFDARREDPLRIQSRSP